MIKKIYLAGGMANLSIEEQKQWRDIFTYKIRKNINKKCDIEIVNPTCYYNFESVRYDTDHEVRQWDLHEVETSDLVIVYFNDLKSIGTAMEIQHANDLGIPVIGILHHTNKNDLHPWLKDGCNKIFNDIYSCVEYLKEFYLDYERRFC